MLEKMKKRQNGFTLLEVIVVMLILGVLAGIGVPAMWTQINRQKAQEAINTMNMMRSVMESCGMMNGGNFSTCGWADTTDVNEVPIDMSNPSNANYTYEWENLADGSYGMKATAVWDASGETSITMTRNASGIMSCAGAGGWEGMC